MRKHAWYIIPAVIFVALLFYFGTLLDKESKIKDQKPFLRPTEDVLVIPKPTTTTFPGGPQAQCESYYPGKNVQPIIFENGALWCDVKN